MSTETHTQSIPDLLIPFSKPRHVGYVLTCYRGDAFIYSIPISLLTNALGELLNRSNLINGTPLTKSELIAIYPHIIGAIALCWQEDLEFYVEGVNLPLDWLDQKMLDFDDNKVIRSEE